MRHKIRGRKLHRPTDQRLALFANLACSLIEHEQIETTLAKAKDLRSFAEKMVTLAKANTLASRRQALSFLRQEESVKKLFTVLAPRYAKRNGGYTRVVKSGFRTGDSAAMAYIEFLDRDENAKGARQKTDVASKKAAAPAAAPQTETKSSAPAGVVKPTVDKGSKGAAKQTAAPKATAHRKVLGP